MDGEWEPLVSHSISIVSAPAPHYAPGFRLSRALNKSHIRRTEDVVPLAFFTFSQCQIRLNVTIATDETSVVRRSADKTSRATRAGPLSKAPCDCPWAVKFSSRPTLPHAPAIAD